MLSAQLPETMDAGTGQPVGDPLTGHTSGVASVALGRVGGRDVIVSGSWDDTVRVWDAGTGQPVGGDPLTGHTSGVASVALGRVGGRDVIVSGSYDGTVRIWDAHRQVTHRISADDEHTGARIGAVTCGDVARTGLGRVTTARLPTAVGSGGGCGEVEEPRGFGQVERGQDGLLSGRGR